MTGDSCGALSQQPLPESGREIAELAEAGVEAIAVCLLHSYRNRAHERAVAAVAEREFLAIAVSLSAEVVPELREYERATTTLANAFVQPLMDPPARVMGPENLQCAGVD